MRSIIFLICLLFSTSVCSQDWMNDKEDLKGQVKSVYYTSRVFSGDGSEEFFQINRFEYNKNGFLIRFGSSETADGKESYSFYRIFDEIQNRCLLEYTLFDGDTSSKHVYEYIEEGRYKRQKNYDKQGTIKYLYNHKGLVTQQLTGISETLYVYDESGRKIKEAYTSETFEQIKTWSYSEDGKLLEEKSEVKKAPPTIVIKVNDDGTYGQEKVLEQNPDDDRSYWISRSYNTKGLLEKETTRYFDGRFQYCKVFAYRSDGNIAQESTITEDGKKVDQLVTYEYDSQGNWIKRLEYWDGKIECIQERVILYY
ncbi:MAG: hypothetical protein ACO1N0_13410 [Fluviicola sp.]